MKEKINKWIEEVKYKYTYYKNLFKLLRLIRIYYKFLQKEVTRLIGIAKVIEQDREETSIFWECTKALKISAAIVLVHYRASKDSFFKDKVLSDLEYLEGALMYIENHIKSLAKLGYPPLIKIDSLFYATMDIRKEINKFIAFYEK